MKATLFFKTSIVLFLFTSISYSQEDWPCEEPVHGTITDIHMDCTTQNILITSFKEDGDSGSSIGGVITTNGSIIISPGYTSVKITAFKESSHHHKSFPRHTTTKIGERGNIGLKSKGKPKNTLERDSYIKTYTNPITNTLTIASTDAKITGYELIDFYGKIILKEQVNPTNKKSILVTQLKKGIYLLKTQFNNGKQQIKTIIKN